jgi:3-hydroxyacyl-CoA dehydrogenase
MLNEKSLTGHAVVVGAGVMGAGIAAWLANLGWRVSLLDRVPDDTGSDAKSRNRLAQEGLDRAIESRPPHFALPSAIRLIRVGNTEDNLDCASDADWVVEAIAEVPEVKRELFNRLATVIGPETILSSNTSGLCLADMVAECPPDVQRRFLGTHFFNPPRYMKPVELIPIPATDPDVLSGVSRFCERVLGKRVIMAKDTPGFISTRLGMYNLAKTMQLAFERGLTVEQVDYLTGPLIGRPKSGTFRLADVVGLDITARIANNLSRDLPNDIWFESLKLLDNIKLFDKLELMVSQGRTGAKSGAGFYKREKSGEILALDWETLDYRPQQEFQRFPKEVEKLPLAERLRRIWEMRPEVDGGFLRDALTDLLTYAADIAPEISDRIVEVDDALISGFGWEVGPFHIIDMLSNQIEWPGKEPAVVARLRETHQPQFYSNLGGKHSYFDFQTGQTVPLALPAAAIRLNDLRKAGKTVEEKDEARLIDLGDGVACFEWRTKMGTLSDPLLDFLTHCHERATKDFAALVIGGGHELFSAGFDLRVFLGQIDSQDWAALDRSIERFQQTNLLLRRSSIPIVAAVGGYTLGGGCELMLHCHAVQAKFESAIGLPEANVGLIPGGGGVTRITQRAQVNLPPGNILEPADPFANLKLAWDVIRSGKFSGSAPEAREMSYLRAEDGITVHPDHVLHDAKTRALGLTAGFVPTAPAKMIAMGENGLARFQWELHLAKRAGQITEHDALVAEKTAWIMCGGDLLAQTELPEERFLELEREAFIALCKTPETRARIVHLLETGKPLRN